MKVTRSHHQTDMFQDKKGEKNPYTRHNRILGPRGIGPMAGWDAENPFSWWSLRPALMRSWDVWLPSAAGFLVSFSVLGAAGLPGSVAFVLALVLTAVSIFLLRKWGHLPVKKKMLARKNWQLRRSWSRVLMESGVIDHHIYRHQEVVPGMTIKRSRHGHKMTLKIPPGQTHESMAKKVPDVALAYLKALRIIVDPETRDTRGGTITYTVLMSDPLAESVPVGDWAIKPNDGSRPVRFGTYLDGSPATQSMWSLHGLTAGTTGSGKSASTHMAIFSALSHPSTQVYMVDLKDGIELGEYASRTTGFGTTIREASDILATVHTEMKKRNEYLVSIGARKAEHLSAQLPASMPPIIVFFDEFGTVEPSGFDSPEEKEVKATVAYYVKEIARLGRSAGISLNLISQRMSTNVISGDSRMLFRNRTAFKADDGASLTMILGEGWQDAGVDLSGPVPPGVGLTAASGQLQEFRGFYLSDEQISDFVRRLPVRDHTVTIERRQLQVEAKELAAQEKSATRKRSPRKSRNQQEEP